MHRPSDEIPVEQDEKFSTSSNPALSTSGLSASSLLPHLVRRLHYTTHAIAPPGCGLFAAVKGASGPGPFLHFENLACHPCLSGSVCRSECRKAYGLWEGKQKADQWIRTKQAPKVAPGLLSVYVSAPLTWLDAIFYASELIILSFEE